MAMNINEIIEELKTFSDEDLDSRELRPGRSLYRVYLKNTNGEIKDIDEDEIRTFMQG